MDAFKPAETERMRLGGNTRWKRFWAEHASADEKAIPWEKEAIPRRYPGFIGEQYKESLSCEVDGKEFVMAERKEEEKSATASVSSPADSRSGTPLSGRRETPMGQGNRVKVDDKYFARLGADNASRRDDLPPSQGGKYGGFGSSPAPAPGAGGDGGLAFDDWQKDSMAAITKGFGWFTSTVSKTAKTVNDGYIQPTASRVRIPLSLSLPSWVTLPRLLFYNPEVTTLRGIKLTYTPSSTSSPSPTSASRPSSMQRPSPAKPRKAPAAPMRTSCASSMARARAAGNAPPRSTSRGASFGTTSPTSASGGQLPPAAGAARLARRPWARGGRRKMSGTGEMYE